MLVMNTSLMLFGVAVVVLVWQLHLQLPMQSVVITTKAWVRISLMARCIRYITMW